MGSSDTYLVEKLKEILQRLHHLPTVSPPSSTNKFIVLNPVSSSEFHLNDKNFNSKFDTIPNELASLHGGGSNKLESSSSLSPSSSDILLNRNLNEFIQALKSSLNTSTTLTLDAGADTRHETTAANLLLHKNQKTSLLILPMMSELPALNGGEGRNGRMEYEFNLTDDDITNLNHLMSSEEAGSLLEIKHWIIIGLYICIAIIAIIGNLLVVEVLVIRSRRLHTLTHALLANLAVADLFMAGLNIPFSISRVILIEWPFGSFLCQAIPFVQVTSVYVTSITMASIALDRYHVIMNPLGRRMKSSEGAMLVALIWLLSGALSLPYAIHHKVVTILTIKIVQRCQTDFVSIYARQLLTVATFFAQYLLPLIITSTSYVSIMHRLGQRTTELGSTTPRQVEAQSRGKRTTIKMLVLTVIFFAVCWAPINVYHILTHFSIVRHNSTAILICHLIAMSSTCYNPFIYCWLNEHFRLEALKWFRCFRTKRSPTVHPGIEINGILTRNDFCRRRNQTNAMIMGGSGGGGGMSFRSQLTGNAAAAGAGANYNFCSSTVTASAGGRGQVNSNLPSSHLYSSSTSSQSTRNFATRTPRGIFPPELLFLTRPSISQQVEEGSEEIDEDDEEVEEDFEERHFDNDEEQHDKAGKGVNWADADISKSDSGELF